MSLRRRQNAGRGVTSWRWTCGRQIGDALQNAIDAAMRCSRSSSRPATALDSKQRSGAMSKLIDGKHPIMPGMFYRYGSIIDAVDKRIKQLLFDVDPLARGAGEKARGQRAGHVEAEEPETARLSGSCALVALTTRCTPRSCSRNSPRSHVSRTPAGSYGLVARSERSSTSTSTATRASRRLGTSRTARLSRSASC